MHQDGDAEVDLTITYDYSECLAHIAHQAKDNPLPWSIFGSFEKPDHQYRLVLFRLHNLYGELISEKALQTEWISAFEMAACFF